MTVYKRYVNLTVLGRIVQLIQFAIQSKEVCGMAMFSLMIIVGISALALVVAVAAIIMTARR